MYAARYTHPHDVWCRYCGVGLPDVLLHLPATDLIRMSNGSVAHLGHAEHGTPDSAAASAEVAAHDVAKPLAQDALAGQATAVPSSRGTRRQRRRPRCHSVASVPETGPSGDVDPVDDALEAVARVAKAGWGRRHIRFGVAGGTGSGSAHRSTSGASSSGGVGSEVANGDVLLEVARVLAHHGLHECPVLLRMLQVSCARPCAS